MKKYILSGLICMTITVTPGCKGKTNDPNTRADEKNLITPGQAPALVKIAVAEKYPDAKDLIWENATENNKPTIKVKFKRDDQYWKAEFNVDGSLIKEGKDN